MWNRNIPDVAHVGFQLATNIREIGGFDKNSIYRRILGNFGDCAKNSHNPQKKFWFIIF